MIRIGELVVKFLSSFSRIKAADEMARRDIDPRALAWS